MILEYLAGAYLSAVSMYALTFSIAGFLRKNRRYVPGNYRHHQFAVLIPAYREDAVIVSVAREALKQNYPADSFEVVVIADSLQPETLEQLSRLNIRLVEVKFEKSTKVKALRAALSQLEEKYDVALILDADNIMEKDFLQKVNKAYLEGANVIQCRRVAKNMNTPFAVLDAFSEIVNNHIYRKGSQALGLSSPLIGSGMAFPLHVLKNTLSEMDAVGGFDRELQVKMLEQGYNIKYLDHAVVLDEKVTKAEVFGNQRRRWLSAQFVYIRKFFKRGMIALFRGNLDLFNMTILNNIQLPRIVVLGLLLLLSAGTALFQKFLDIPYYFWLMLLGSQVLAMLLAVPLKFYNRNFLFALLSIPRAFLIMCRSLLRIKGANREFIHTPHTTQV